jgi:hypothetical protein
MHTRAITILAVLAVVACEAIEPELQLPEPASRAIDASGVDTYEIRTVGTRIRGFSINDGGEVVGQYFPADASHFSAFIWSPETGTVDEIPATITSQLVSHRINNLGVVAGTYEVGGTTRGYRWTEADGLEQLPAIASSVSDGVRGLNDGGTAVGVSYIGGDFRAVRWSSDGTSGEVLEPLSDPGVAGAINVHGDIAGDDPDGMFLWTPTEVIRMGLGGGATRYAPLAINAHREIVGYYLSDGVRRAFYWSEAHGLIDLHATAGFTTDESFANDINDAGEVAISAGPFEADAAGYVWTRDGGFVPLPSPGAPFGVNGINSHGQLVGATANTSGPDLITFVWTPVPADQTDELADMIDELIADGALDEPYANGLLATLNAVQQKLDQGDTQAAINLLHAFINQVKALVASGRLSPEDGDALIAEAEALIASLS